MLASNKIIVLFFIAMYYSVTGTGERHSLTMNKVSLPFQSDEVKSQRSKVKGQRRLRPSPLDLRLRNS